MSLIPTVVDMIDATVGVLESPEYLEHVVMFPNDPSRSLSRSQKGCSE